MSDTQSLIDAMRRKAQFHKRVTGDGENETHLILLAAADALTVERTRADKAEAEVARLREVIERAKEWADEITGGRPITNDFKRISRILAAVPVEPQTDHEGSQR